MQTIPPVPALSQRCSGVKFSVVRDLLALTERPGVISFAGGLPAPELFDAEGARAPESPPGTPSAACPRAPRTSW